MSKQEVQQENIANQTAKKFIEDRINDSSIERPLLDWCVAVQNKALTAKQWQLLHKVKYYVKKYQTELNQIEAELTD